MKKEIRQMSDDGKMVQVTIADERWYTKEDEDGVITAYPSVTWITDHYPKGIGFYKWLAQKGWDEAEAIKESAGDTGHKAHQLITELLKGKDVEIDGMVQNSDTGDSQPIELGEYDAAASFVDWYNLIKKVATPIANELVVFNDEYFYAGTADFILKLDEAVKIDRYTTMEAGTWLIDFKTGQSVWPNYGLQVSAYKHALKGKHEIDHMGILQVGYSRNKNKWKLTKMADQFDLFQATRKIWQNEAKNTDVFKADYPVKLSLGLPVSKAIKS